MSRASSESWTTVDYSLGVYEYAPELLQKTFHRSRRLVVTVVVAHTPRVIVLLSMFG